MKTTTYYLIKKRILGKKVEEKDRTEYYLFQKESWIPDGRLLIFMYLMGYDPTEPEDSPYGIGNSDILEQIEEISLYQAAEFIFRRSMPLEGQKDVSPKRI